MYFLRFNEGCGDPYRRKIPCKSKHPFLGVGVFCQTWLGCKSKRKQASSHLQWTTPTQRKDALVKHLMDHEDKQSQADKQKQTRLDPTMATFFVALSPRKSWTGFTCQIDQNNLPRVGEVDCTRLWTGPCRARWAWHGGYMLQHGALIQMVHANEYFYVHTGIGSIVEYL